MKNHQRLTVLTVLALMVMATITGMSMKTTRIDPPPMTLNPHVNY